jgi:hypothetical protein
MSANQQNRGNLISAQVVLRSANGRQPDQGTPVTSANIKDFQPSMEIVAAAKEAFAAKGFEIGDLVGNSFSISAPADKFEKIFKTHLRFAKHGSAQAMGDDGSWSEELPLGGLPKSMSRNLVAVTFARALDFGPTSFS